MLKQLLIPLVAFCLFSISSLPAQNGVGIGTLTPAYLLDVHGSPSNSQLVNINSKVNYVGNLDIRAMQGNSVTADGYGIGGSFTGGYKGAEGIAQGGSYNGSVFGLVGSANGTTGVRVGVYGSATGGAFNYGIHGLVTGGAGYYAVYGQSTNISGFAGYFAGRGHFTEELRADKNLIVDNNLGVGTNAPGSKLHILGGSDAGLASNGYAQFGPSTSWNLVVDDNEIIARSNGAGGDLLFQQDAGNILMCGLELGKVGIGVQFATNLPTGYMLAVDGKIIGEELRIQNSNNWPDYVFAEQYDLMPLEDLKQSITIHRHLPNIPSAKEVEEEGILIGDMQKRMMEKIEELTLYVIQLHETSQEQAKEIERLKQKIENVQPEK